MTRISGTLKSATGINISEGPPEQDYLEAEEPGGAGEPGPPGPQGPPGPPGEGAYHMHVQSTPAASWVIDHDLLYRPAVTVVDSAGSQVEGDVTYYDSQVVVSFSGAFAGTAYLT